jgi:large subunit ribosomal protein L29
MKIEEIRSKTDSELDFERNNMKKELFDLRFRSAVDTVQSTARISELRRSIARVNTVLHERNNGVRGQQPQ